LLQSTLLTVCLPPSVRPLSADACLSNQCGGEHVHPSLDESKMRPVTSGTAAVIRATSGRRHPAPHNDVIKLLMLLMLMPE